MTATMSATTSSSQSKLLTATPPPMARMIKIRTTIQRRGIGLPSVVGVQRGKGRVGCGVPLLDPERPSNLSDRRRLARPDAAAVLRDEVGGTEDEVTICGNLVRRLRGERRCCGAERRECFLFDPPRRRVERERVDAGIRELADELARARLALPDDVRREGVDL